jgi:hypothetical protein
MGRDAAGAAQMEEETSEQRGAAVSLEALVREADQGLRQKDAVETQLTQARSQRPGARRCSLCSIRHGGAMVALPCSG